MDALKVSCNYCVLRFYRHRFDSVEKIVSSVVCRRGVYAHQVNVIVVVVYHNGKCSSLVVCACLCDLFVQVCLE